jgi:integrase
MTPAEIEARCREAWSARGLRPKTIQSYVLVYRRAERLAGELGTTVLELTATQVREIAERWPRTRSSRIQLRTALVHVWRACDCPVGRSQAVPVPTKPRYRCRALAEAPAAILAAVAAADETPAGLAVMLGLYAGLRREEIARLEWAHIDDSGWLRVIGKRDVSAEVPLHPELVEALRATRSPRGASAFVFPGRVAGHVSPATVWTWSRRIGRRALGVQVPTHVLRHTAIATLNDATGDLRAAQEFARHRSPETTEVYTRVSRRRLEEAVARIHYGGCP